MPLERVCICKAYADGEYMRMFDLCRCQAYGYATPIYSSLFFPPRSDFWLSRKQVIDADYHIRVLVSRACKGA